ncbi:MAG: hypothetical protein HY893_07760 [Deltaproteobacteria bacterium]|nr:hypothetical protein [Deltaproteobacteria bacterium]
MDLEIDIECRGCGLHFRDNFREMPHGRVLKCPFCSSTALGLKGQMLKKRHRDPCGFELSPGERLSLERKSKL